MMYDPAFEPLYQAMEQEASLAKVAPKLWPPLVCMTALATLFLAGCTQTVVSDYCLNARPITFSASQDSMETIRQVREHNAVFKQLCR